jgi:uncharacterized protein
MTEWKREGFDPAAVTRPVPELLRYYTVVSLFTLVLFPIVFLPLYFRYRTLRYRIDEEGVSMSWGVLFRREVYLTYRRLQDIQMTRGVIQRRLGLADLHLHTASGSSGAEMKLEGLPDPEAFRDFLYERMQGAEEEASTPDPTPVLPAPSDVRQDSPRGRVVPRSPTGEDEVLVLLTEIRDELRRRNRVTGHRTGGEGK